MRQGLQGMVQALENHGVTTLLISESFENGEIPLEWFVTSGIIYLDQKIIDNSIKRTFKSQNLAGLNITIIFFPYILEKTDYL